MNDFTSVGGYSNTQNVFLPVKGISLQEKEKTSKLNTEFWFFFFSTQSVKSWAVFERIFVKLFDYEISVY